MTLFFYKLLLEIINEFLEILGQVDPFFLLPVDPILQFGEVLLVVGGEGIVAGPELLHGQL